MGRYHPNARTYWRDVLNHWRFRFLSRTTCRVFGHAHSAGANCDRCRGHRCPSCSRYL